MNLSDIIENMRNSGTREEQDRRDAARYRYLKEFATLEDLYDMLGQGPSSWDWVVRLESGKSKGASPPADTPSFDATVDANMYRDGYIDLPRAPKMPLLPFGATIIRTVVPTEIPFNCVPTGTQKCGICRQPLLGHPTYCQKNEE